METHTPQLGARMSPEQAKGYVDSVNKKALQRWQERVAQGPFMSRFLKGNLPLTAIRLFFENWGNFTVEINTLIACSYHKHIGFFKRHAGVMHRAAAELAG